MLKYWSSSWIIKDRNPIHHRIFLNKKRKIKCQIIKTRKIEMLEKQDIKYKMKQN